MTDFRALCAELVEKLDEFDRLLHRAQYVEHPLTYRARAALSETQPEPPTDGEVVELVAWLRATAETLHEGNIQTPRLTRAADLLERLVPQPVPVSERLPGPEDCDREGNVWAWRRFDPEGGIDNGDFWCLPSCEWLGDEDSGFTHWLPAHALPVPQP